MKRPHLLAIACDAGPGADIGTLINIAEAAGWSTKVTATPSAVPFLDVSGIEMMTGAAPRTGFHPHADRGQTRTVHKADAIIIAPATYNSVNKLAAGFADNYALTVVVEMVGLGLPTVVVPFVNAALARRTPYRNALRALETDGVYLLGRPVGAARPRNRLPTPAAVPLATIIRPSSDPRAPSKATAVTRPKVTPNDLLRSARMAMLSPSGSLRPMWVVMVGSCPTITTRLASRRLYPAPCRLRHGG